MKETDVLIIGSSAAGLNTAITGKNNFPEKDFLVVHKEEKLMGFRGVSTGTRALVWLWAATLFAIAHLVETSLWA